MHVSRRNFIKTAGSLTIGFCLGGEAFQYPASVQGPGLGPSPALPLGSPPSLGEYSGINAWLEVLANGSVRVFSGKLELGQGIRTAIAQVAAEELDMEMSQVEVVLAETGRTPNEGYTAGSGSIEGSAMAVRHAAAAARQKLMELASQKMSVPVTELNMAEGRVSLKKGDRVLTFAEILDGKQLTARAVRWKERGLAWVECSRLIPTWEFSRRSPCEPSRS